MAVQDWRSDTKPSCWNRMVALYRAVAVLVLNTLLLLAVLGLAVGASIFLDRRRLDPRAELSIYASQQWAAKYWNESLRLSQQGVRYDPYVIWRQRPFKGSTINVNQKGIRQTPGADCRAGSYKVFTLGGSTMWGFGAPDWATIAAYVQGGLEVPGSKPVCVTNLAEGAFVSTQEVIQLQLELQSGNVPDLVVFYDGMNDVYAAYQSGLPAAHQNLSVIAAKFECPPFLPCLGASTRFLRLTSFFADPKPVTYQSMGIDTNVLADSVARVYLSNYRIVKALSNEYGFRFFFFLQPLISVGSKPLARGERERMLRNDRRVDELTTAAYQRIERAGSEHDRLVNLTHVFDHDHSEIYIDDMHLTPEGNKLVAGKMLGVINRQLLPPQHAR